MKNPKQYFKLLPALPGITKVSKGNKRVSLKTLAVAVLLLLTTSYAQAVTKTWGPATGGAWNVAANWSPSGIPVAGDDVIIGLQSGNITAVPTISLLSLTINGNCTLVPSVNSRITVTGTLTISSGATLSLGTVSSPNLNLNLAATSTSFIYGSGKIDTNSSSAAGYVYCRGSLTIEEGALITGNNTFRVWSGGTLIIANTSGITITGASGAIQVTGTRTYSSGANYIYNGSAAQVTGNGLAQNIPSKLTINNSAGVTLSAATTISGLLSMTNGILNLDSFNLTTGSLTGSSNITGTSGTLTLAIGSDNTSPAAYSGVISDGTATSVAVTKNGTGTLILSGSNSYTGVTTLNTGILKLGAAGDATNTPLGTTGSETIVTANASLDLNGFTLGTSEPLTLISTGIAAGGALTNSSSTAASYSGLITLGSASSIVANAGDINITNPGTITGVFGLTLGGTGNGNVISIIGTGAGTVAKIGTGIWTLSGANTYTGQTTINAGTIKLGAAGDGTNSPLGTNLNRTNVTSGAALDLNGFTLGIAELLYLNGTGVSNGGALTNSSPTAVSYSGLIRLISSSSIVSNAGDISITNVGIITGATFDLTLGGTGNGSVTSVIGTGSGTVTKTGTGTWTLSRANTYTGLTSITAGTLKLGIAGGAVNTPLGTIAAGTTVSSGAVLDLNGFNLGTAEELTLNGTGFSNGGSLTNSSVTAVSYNGDITLNSPSSIGTTGDITSTGIISGGNSLTKVGPGTLILSGNNSFSGGLIISSGTVQLGAADRIATQEVTLNGGIFSTGETIGYNETVGTLALNDNSTIALGTGSHTLNFANSSGVSWTPGKLLIITGWEGSPGALPPSTAGKIFFGSTIDDLSPSQVAQIQFLIGGSYFAATILGTGEVVPSPLITITTGTISGSPFCAEGLLAVPFTTTGSYTPGNVFTAELSDATGGFSSPVAIGTLTQTDAGIIPATIPAGTSAGTGYRIRVVSTTPAVTGSDNGSDLAVNAPGTWLGGTSADWNDASNWCGGIPISSTDVTITSSALNMPVINTSPTAICNNLTIDPAASLTVGETGQLTVSNALTNNGDLTLQSSATGISSLIVTAFSGNDASVELFLTGGGVKTTYKWHYISTPVSLLSVSTFAPGTTLDLAQYIEDRPTLSLREGWVAYDGYVYSNGELDGPTFSDLTPGIGYNYWNDTDYNFTFSGQLNTADVPVELGFGGDANLHGFNLLGNPFSSGLNWDDIINSVYFTYPSSTSKGLYFTRDNVQCSYIGGVGNPGDVTGIIPPMQGFFNKTYSTGNTITIPAAARVQGAIHPRYKGASQVIPLVRLSLAEGKLSDETVVRFDADAKSDLDYDFDAIKMFLAPDLVSIYSSTTGTKYSINGLPFPDPNVEIPVVVNLTKDTIHTISAKQLQGLDDYSVTLTDNTTQITTDLKSTPVVTFSSTAGTIADRFILKIGTITTGIEIPVGSKSTFNIYPSNNFINIRTISDEWDGKSGSVNIIDLTGKTLINQNNTEFSKNSMIQIASPAAKGIYIVEVKSGVMRFVGKVVIK